MLDIDSLDMLINAVENYGFELEKNRKILENAANVCDQAMGSDEISKKQIAKLNEALYELQHTSSLVKNAAEALKKDKILALDTLED